MSFEDDEYWDEEYSEFSLMPKSAVIQERTYERRTAPDPVIPTRRRPDDADDTASAGKQAFAQPFEPTRPNWLNDPDFVPIDTSQPNLAGTGFDGIDFNRPELGADFDTPDLVRSVPSTPPRGGGRATPYPDDIDQPYDHRDLRAYGHGRTGTVWSTEPAAEPAPRPSPATGRARVPAPRAEQQPAATLPAPDEQPGTGQAPGTESGDAPSAPERPGRRPRPRVAEYNYDWVAEPDPPLTGPQTPPAPVETPPQSPPASAPGSGSPEVAPRVVSRAVPVQPRVLRQSPPAPAPRVLRRAEPQPAPRVVETAPPPAAPARPPLAPTAHAADAAPTGPAQAAWPPIPATPHAASPISASPISASPISASPLPASPLPASTLPAGADQDGDRPEVSAADLAAIRWRLDGATLREVVDDPSALHRLGERLDEPLATECDNVVRAGLLSVRAEIYRLLGELGMAAAASRLALAHAESAQDLQATVIAKAELAHVLRLRGDFAAADRLFSWALNTPVPAAVHSVVHENAGRSCFDQGRYMEALDHFAQAARLGNADDDDLSGRIATCLDTIYVRVLRDGWGPYPRRSPADAATGSTAESR